MLFNALTAIKNNWHFDSINKLKEIANWIVQEHSKFSVTSFYSGFLKILFRDTWVKVKGTAGTDTLFNQQNGALAFIPY